MIRGVEEEEGSTFGGMCQFELEVPKVFCEGRRPLYKVMWRLLLVALDDLLLGTT